MGASEIGVEEQLLQKRYHKNYLDCIGTSEKPIGVVQLKK